MGFLRENLKKYFEQRKIKILVMRQIMRYNYDNHLNNTQNIAEYNDYLLQQVSNYSSLVWHQTLKSITSQYTEADIVKHFFAADRNILNMEGLRPVFLLYCFGLLLSVVVFCLELLYFRFKK